MKTPTRISQVLLAMFALAAFMMHSLPGTESCQTEAGHGADESIEDAHCLCAHGMQSAEVPLSLAAGMAGCESGCACMPARSQWQSQLPGRIQPEQRGQDRAYFEDQDPEISIAASSPRPGHHHNPSTGRDCPDPVLLCLGTVVLLA